MDQLSFYSEIKKAHQTLRPLVVFRYPKSKVLKAYIQQNDKLNNDSIDALSGFAFAPFDNHNNVILFKGHECDIITSMQGIGEDIRNNSVFEEGNHGKENHEKLVSKAIDELKVSVLKKVVLSRKIMREVKVLDFMGMFNDLLNDQNAFVYCWYHPKIGMWLGASPETLCHIDGLDFTTMALAGTRLNEQGLDKKWGKKEQHEQDLVTQYLKNQLNDYQLHISTPYTTVSGDVAHIRTDLSGKLNKGYLLSNLIHKIHPTPAVCGMPMQLAKQFILDNEGYSRSYYTGYLGEVNVAGKTRLHVNLRCMEHSGILANVYVGGGITSASNPHAEWLETKLKGQGMLTYLDAHS